jgi:hypothetical protein
VPRSNRPRRSGRPRPSTRPEPLDAGRALSGVPRRETHADGEWFVRSVAGPAASKTYRCPGCDHEIPAGVAHLVVWAADDFMGDVSAMGDRRHWHRPCWDARGRRGPRR